MKKSWLLIVSILLIGMSRSNYDYLLLVSVKENKCHCLASCYVRSGIISDDGELMESRTYVHVASMPEQVLEPI